MRATYQLNTEKLEYNYRCEKNPIFKKDRSHPSEIKRGVAP
jgi:hypothetical protein